MRNIYFIIILTFSAFLFSYQLGSSPLLDPDEPRYAEAGREMLESGNYVVPKFNYHKRLEKPILFYWMEAGSQKVLGTNEFSARLPSVLAGLGMIILAFLLGNVQNIGIISSLIMLSTLEILLISRMAITDMVLCFFISAAIAFFYLGYVNREKFKSEFAFKKRISSRWIIASLVCAGFGFLTKGPLAVVLPSLVVFPYLWWQKDLVPFIKDNIKEITTGMIGFLVITLPWYLSIHFRTGGEFTKSFFLGDNLERFTKVVSHHSGEWWFYIPVLIVGFMPWSVFFIQSFLNPDVYMDPFKPNEGRIQKQLPSFCLWWFAVIFLFLSISQTKLVTYILPVYLPLTIITAKWWDIKFRATKKKSQSNLDALIGLLALLIIAIGFLYFGMSKLDLVFKLIDPPDLFIPIVIASTVLGSFACIAMTAIMKQPKISFSFVLSGIIVFHLMNLNFFYPAYVSYMQEGIRDFVRSVPESSQIFCIKSFKPSVTFYAKRKVQVIKMKDFIDKALPLLKSDQEVYFITRERYLNKINQKLLDSKIEEPVYSIIKKDHRFVYGSNKINPELIPASQP